MCNLVLFHDSWNNEYLLVDSVVQVPLLCLMYVCYVSINSNISTETQKQSKVCAPAMKTTQEVSGVASSGPH